MAFAVKLAPFAARGATPSYEADSEGNTVTASGNKTVPVIGNGNAANVGNMTSGFIRIKTYAMTGTSPSFQLNVFANTSTGEQLASFPALTVASDLTVPFVSEAELANVYLVYTVTGTTPSIDFDFDAVGF